MILYGLKTCDTCRKARRDLPDATFVDVRDEGVPHDLLARAQDAFGAALLNTRSTTWRGLSEEDRARAPLELMTEHPALMKRPLVAEGDRLFLGWDAGTRAAVMGDDA